MRRGSKPSHDPEKKRRCIRYSVKEASNANFKEGGRGRFDGIEGSADGCSSSGE